MPFPPPPQLVDRIFWILFPVELAISLLLIVYLLGWGLRSAGPEGPVGAWITFLPPLFLGAAWLLFTRFESEALRILIVALLALPVLQAPFGGARALWVRYQAHRFRLGDSDFARGLLRELAHAIEARDPDRVRTLLDAGALRSQPKSVEGGGQTILYFALCRIPLGASPANPAMAPALEIVRLILAAGADPNEPAFGSSAPLGLAISLGAEVTGLLLAAGADPNLSRGPGRPLWWEAVASGAKSPQLLELLLEHGADVGAANSPDGFGVVGWAVYHRNWDAAWLLVQRGAPDGREDSLFGSERVIDAVARALEASSGDNEPALRELARYYGVTPV